MAVMLSFEMLQGVLGMHDATDLLEETSSHEGMGRTFIAPKIVTDFEDGSMRVLLAADYKAGFFATKAYHNIQDVGVRYVVSLYLMNDGELLALLDGQTITDLHTGAASGVVARKTPAGGPVSIGVIGTGHRGP